MPVEEQQLESLRLAVADMNDATDTLREALAEFEATLGKLSIGIGVWLEGNEIVVGDDAWIIGYGKVERGVWRLQAKVKEHPRVIALVGESGRELRAEAAALLPLLVATLVERAKHIAQAAHQGAAQLNAFMAPGREE